MLDLEETICAIASPPGAALRGIVRVSGPATIEVLSRLLAPGADGLERGGRPRRWETSIDLGEPLGALPLSVLLWPTPRSYTGQPSAELHLPGAAPILQAALAQLVAAGARTARAGEFTLRAFLAGRLDLTQAEAVLGVIDAHDRRSLDAALDQMAGGLATPLRGLRQELLHLLADTEAGLDFVDEDLQFVSDAQLAERLEVFAETVERLAARMRAQGRGDTRPRVVFQGAPNVGKSSLINALSGHSASIVSPRAGTTRDWIEARATIRGLEVELIDTAGLGAVEAAEESAAAIDVQSQGLTLERVERADLVLHCVEATELLRHPRPPTVPLAGAGSWLGVATKSDRLENEELVIDLQSDESAEASGGSDPAERSESELPGGWILTSSTSGRGLDLLRQRIAAALDSRHDEAGQAVVGTAARCRETLREAAAALQRGIELAQAGGGHELVAAEIRCALDALGQVTGEVYTEEILDAVFSRFCIGK